MFRQRTARPASGRLGAGMIALGLNSVLIGVMSWPADRRAASPGTAGPIWVDLEPWPARPPARQLGKAKAPYEPAANRSRRHAHPAEPAGSVSDDAPPAPASIAVEDSDIIRRQAMARALRGGVLGCALGGELDPEERRACQERRAALARDATPINGSGDAARDAVFARQGARRLDAWERRRAQPSPGDPPCETPHPVAGCEGVNIQVDLFSTRDGFLPNLRKRRE